MYMDSNEQLRYEGQRSSQLIDIYIRWFSLLIGIRSLTFLIDNIVPTKLQFFLLFYSWTSIILQAQKLNIPFVFLFWGSFFRRIYIIFLREKLHLPLLPTVQSFFFLIALSDLYPKRLSSDTLDVVDRKRGLR